MKHASLPHHHYVKVPNSLLGPKMPSGSTNAILHGIYGHPGQLVLTHLLLETGAHWSGIPLILLNDGSFRQCNKCKKQFKSKLIINEPTIYHK